MEVKLREEMKFRLRVVVVYVASTRDLDLKHLPHANANHMRVTSS